VCVCKAVCVLEGQGPKEQRHPRTKFQSEHIGRNLPEVKWNVK